MNGKKKLIEEEVEKTLRLLDTREEIEADPYFYTRLEKKMTGYGRSSRSPLHAVFVAGWVRPALLTVLVVLNVAVAVIALKDSRNRAYSRDNYIAVLADEYSLDQSDSNVFIMQ